MIISAYPVYRALDKVPRSVSTLFNDFINVLHVLILSPTKKSVCLPNGYYLIYSQEPCFNFKLSAQSGMTLQLYQL